MAENKSTPNTSPNITLHYDKCERCDTYNQRPTSLHIRPLGYLAVYECQCGHTWMTDWYVPEVGAA